MCKNPAPPAAEPLKLAADPWAFWLILQSRFLNCPQPAIGDRAADGRRNQVSFLAKRKKDQQQWPDDSTLTETLKPLGLKVEFTPVYKNPKNPNKDPKNPNTIGTGSIFRDTDITPADHASPEELLQKRVVALDALKKQFDRLKIARPVKPQLRDALAAICISEGRDKAGEKERRGGSGVVVGFVDNGCAFAHPNFLIKDGQSYRSRVTRIWDQSLLRKYSEKWSRPNDFGYGFELEVEKYNPRTGRLYGAKTGECEELTEDQLYAEMDYELKEDVVIDGMFGPADFTHGTHIMDIAVGANGVAPDAEIVFVQLPQFAVSENTDQASARHILDGVAYIFNYAAKAKKPAVVNISYNAYTGPHDGTSLVELGLDELLETPGRAVVISAGNARDANCHECRTVPAKQCPDGESDDNRQTLYWSVNPDDPTENFMDIWYDGRPNPKIDPQTEPPIDLQISVYSPDGECVADAVGPDQYSYLKRGHAIMGAVIHRKDDLGNHKNQVLIALNPTVGMDVRDSDKSQDAWLPAASGIWRVEVRNPSNASVTFHAWIERDNRGEDPLVKQSQFLTSRLPMEGEEEDGEEFRNATPEERHTLGGFCTGKQTIVVGAYNLMTGRAMPYSSLGPTVDGHTKPDIYAPGSSDPAGDGIEAASAMSANLVRMSGTSVAAPFVTGLIACEFSKVGSDWPTLNTEKIIALLKQDGEKIVSPDKREDAPIAIRIKD